MKLVSAENPNPSQLIIYQTHDGKTRLDVRLDQETVWLTLNQMAELFQRDKAVISRHIRNVFNEERSQRPSRMTGSQKLHELKEINYDPR